MEALSPSTKIYLADSKIPNAGRGVFAAQDISKSALIERCPVLLLIETETPVIQKTKLMNYYSQWTEDRSAVHPTAICLGFGSLFNHSYQPNATYQKRFAENVIDFLAVKAIKRGEEITVNYNYGNPDDKKQLWIKEIPPAG